MAEDGVRNEKKGVTSGQPSSPEKHERHSMGPTAWIRDVTKIGKKIS
jgi:hypothetical protein